MEDCLHLKWDPFEKGRIVLFCPKSISRCELLVFEGFAIWYDMFLHVRYTYPNLYNFPSNYSDCLIPILCVEKLWLLLVYLVCSFLGTMQYTLLYRTVHQFLRNKNPNSINAPSKKKTSTSQQLSHVWSPDWSSPLQVCFPDPLTLRNALAAHRLTNQTSGMKSVRGCLDMS